MRIFRRILSFLPNFKPYAPLRDHSESFEKDSAEGWSLFPGSGINLFRIRVMLKLMIFRNIWGRFSLPVRVFAVAGCIATASGAVYVTHSIFIAPKETEILSEKPEQIVEKLKYKAFSSFPEKSESETDVAEPLVSDLRKAGTSDYIPQIRTIQYQSVSVTPETENTLRYSTFREVRIHRFRFVDFSPLYAPGKPLLVPMLSGLEAKFENRDIHKHHESLPMADTISYISLLGNIAVSLESANYREADRLVNLLAGQRPEDENAMYYKGYIHYCLKEYDIALRWFRMCENSAFRAFYHEARLHRAYILHLTGKQEEALALIRSMELENSVYVKQALSLKSTITQTEKP